jgi:hypothetical protein
LAVLRIAMSHQIKMSSNLPFGTIPKLYHLSKKQCFK